MQYHRDTTASQHNLAQMANTEKKGEDRQQHQEGIRATTSNPENQLLLIIQQSLHSNTTITLASQPSTTNNHQSSTMAFFKTLIFASVAAVAFAAPSGG
jgi:response regulator of citrate/malate metabolism